MKIRFVIGVLAAVGAWFVLRQWAYVSHDIEWECWGGECSTDDARSMLVVGGAALAVLALAMLVTVLRVLGIGLVLAAGAFAMVTGWEAAFADGEVDVLSGQVGFWRGFAIVGGFIALLGLVIEWRLPGPAWRLLGWARVPGELSDFRDGTATLAFTDGEGHRHAVRTRVPEQLRDQPVYAYYQVRDPSRARAAPGKQQVLKPAKRDGDTPLSTELTRLAALHAEGHLTDEEFDQAKRRVLGG